jgi:hypothetical protein
MELVSTISIAFTRSADVLLAILQPTSYELLTARSGTVQEPYASTHLPLSVRLGHPSAIGFAPLSTLVAYLGCVSSATYFSALSFRLLTQILTLMDLADVPLATLQPTYAATLTECLPSIPEFA